jgi:hypothetical protein
MGVWGGGGQAEEEIEDIVGVMAEAGYGLDYDDAQGLIKKTRDGPNPYDAAQSFGEANLTVTQLSGGIKTKSGALSIGGKDSEVVTRPADNQVLNDSRSWGLVLEPQIDLVGLKVTLSDNHDGANQVALTDGSQNVLESKSGDFTAGDVVEFNTALTAGNKYDVAVYNGGNSYDVGQQNSPTLPNSGNEIEITAGVQHPLSSGTRDVRNGQAYAFNDITAKVVADSGTAALEWPRPTDLFEWDVATFTSTPDGETVDVYVAYSTDGGSTWTRTNDGNPISRDYSLADDPTISASDEVRIEAELSRANTANNPRLDAAYRSWKV